MILVHRIKIRILPGKIRSLNGYNDNPMALQFISAYRKLLHQIDISISSFSNVTCQGFSNIFTVSSVTKHPNTAKEHFVPERIEEDEEEWIDALELQSYENFNHLTDTHDTGISYMANILEKRLMSGSIYCNLCKKVLEMNENVNDCMCVDYHNGKPCISTYQLCKLTDSALKMYINTGLNFK